MVEKPQAPVSPSTDDHLRAVVKSYFSTSKEPTTNTEEVCGAGERPKLGTSQKAGARIILGISLHLSR